MAKAAKPITGAKPDNILVVEQSPDETGAQATARKILEPHMRHALTASTFAGKILGTSVEPPGLMDFIVHVQSATKKAEGGDLAIASRLLAAQAITLDSMFTELARRAALNMGEYLDAAERYGRLALKAQSNCRATVEALAKLHQPREQTVRHVHVNEGGQAIVADQFHHHPGVAENGKFDKQSHASRPAQPSAALSSADANGGGMPIPGSARQAPLPNARRHQPGSA